MKKNKWEIYVNAIKYLQEQYFVLPSGGTIMMASIVVSICDCNYYNNNIYFPFYFSYNKLSTGAAATKSVLSDAGSKTASAAKNVGSATAKKIGEIR